MPKTKQKKKRKRKKYTFSKIMIRTYKCNLQNINGPVLLVVLYERTIIYENIIIYVIKHVALAKTKGAL